MDRGLTGRTSTPLSVTRPNLALVLAAALLAALPAQGVGAVGHVRPDGARETAASAGRADLDRLADIAWALDYDVEGIFRFVADEIRYEPYSGILRGARGTLDARAGNSVDQALLLAALLDESAVPYRFARGSLDETTTTELIDSMASDAAEARLIAEDGLARGWDELAASVPSPPGASGALAELDEEPARRAAAEARERLAVAESRLGQTVTMIETALDGAGITLPADGVSLPASEVAEHTWVQVQYGAGWLDLDPTLGDSEPGTVLTTASETLDSLPDDLRHRVELAVLVERVRGGQLLTDAVLEYTAFADEIAGIPITFGHNTPTGLQQFGIALRTLLGDGWVDYRPTLAIGGTSLVADEAVAFGLAGAEGEGGLLEDSELFSDGDAPGDHRGPADGEAIAEWLEVRVTRPGSEPAVARRTVFDRLPAEVRHGGGEVTVDDLEALGPIEPIDPDGSGVTDFPPMLGVEAFAIATGPTSAAEVLERLPDDQPGTVALAYHLLRDAMAARMAIDAGARTFLDGPDIVSFSLDLDEPGPEPAVRVGFDIWHRNHGILPLTPASVTVPEAELVAGVMGHIAERVALEGLAEGPDVGRHTIGVGALFEAAASEGVPTVVLHGALPGPLPYGHMATRLIEDALASGDVVVIPAEPVMVGDSERVGWWRIDPTTGVTTDVMDDGSGQEVVEYATLETGRVRQFVCYGAMANWAAASIIAAAAMVTSLAESAIFRLFNSGWGGTRCFGL